MRIGEVAHKVGMATSAIRYYEEAGLIPEPERASSGYRMYDPEVIDRLLFIRSGQAVGLTLRELADVLQIRDGGEAPCGHMRNLIDRHIQEIEGRMRDLRRLRKELTALADAASQLDPTQCAPDSICQILGSTS